MSSSGKGRRLSPAEWLEIRTRYIAGDKVIDLASEFNVSRENISRRASKEGWKRKEGLIEEAAQELEHEIKSDWKQQARESNLQQFKAWQYVAGIIINKFKEIKEGRLAGRAAYELASLSNSLKIAFDGMRLTMAMDGVNTPFAEDEEQDMDAIERLTRIMTPLPASPSDLVAEAIGPKQVNIRWKDASGDVTGFRIERADAGKLAFQAIGTVPANVTGFQDKKVLPGRAYIYRVFATSDVGDSLPSDTVTITTPEMISAQAA